MWPARRLSLLLVVTCCLTLASVVDVASADQECPGRTPWRLKCSQYCCLEEMDEPLEGQYCCSSCRSSFDATVRNSFACTANHYLHQSWAVVLMACGIAFVVLVCCTCCCCCCCAPCRNGGGRRRGHGRSYSLATTAKHQRDYGGCGGPGVAVTVVNNERIPLLFAAPHEAAAMHPSPSAPPPAAGGGPTASGTYPQKGQPLPPPYQVAAAASSVPPPPVYQP